MLKHRVVATPRSMSKRGTMSSKVIETAWRHKKPLPARRLGDLRELRSYDLMGEKTDSLTCVPWSKVAILGMVIPPLIGNPYNGYINPYYWVEFPIPHYMEIMGV